MCSQCTMTTIGTTV